MTKFLTLAGQNVVAEYKPLAWQKAGLTYTASGYGAAIPTVWMVTVGSRKYRVYVCQYSNAGTAYIRRGGRTIRPENIVS